jgi:hypothetical protein
MADKPIRKYKAPTKAPDEKKPPFKPGIAAHQRYRTADGMVCPGVTTVLGLLNKPALVPWAWKLGMQGLDYRKTLDQAANIGSIVHDMIDCFHKGTESNTDAYPLRDVQQAQVAFHNYVEWWTAQGLKCVGSEVGVVSEKHRFGGTIDRVALKISTGKLWLIDTKTSKGIFPEHRYQQAAYKEAWNETHAANEQIDETFIVRLDKETGAIDFHSIGTDLTVELNIFLHLRAIYELTGRLDNKRRADKEYRIPYWYD